MGRSQSTDERHAGLNGTAPVEKGLFHAEREAIEVLRVRVDVGYGVDIVIVVEENPVLRKRVVVFGDLEHAVATGNGDAWRGRLGICPIGWEKMTGRCIKMMLPPLLAKSPIMFGAAESGPAAAPKLPAKAFGEGAAAPAVPSPNCCVPVPEPLPGAPEGMPGPQFGGWQDGLRESATATAAGADESPSGAAWVNAAARTGSRACSLSLEVLESNGGGRVHRAASPRALPWAQA